MDGAQDANTKPKVSKSHDGYILMIVRMMLFNCEGLETKVERMVPYRPPETNSINKREKIFDDSGIMTRQLTTGPFPIFIIGSPRSGTSMAALVFVPA